MKKIIVVFLVLVSSITLSQRSSVLFVGNSYTGANNLPLLTSQVANSAGFTLNYSAQTPGGAQLSQHINNTAIINAIYSQQWDHVVLQEQSQKPSFNPAYVSANVFPYAKRLCDTIRMNDSCTRPIFYMTWGRKFGDAGNCSASPWLCTYDGMDSALAVSYNSMGAQNDAFVSPVGAVWNYIVKNHPTINLYTSDNSHPNINGSYAAACTFFTVIFREDPNLITFNSTVNSTIAADIRNAVKKVCFDSLVKWNVGKYDPVSNFSFNQFGSTFVFANSSVKSDSYQWSFGDGGNSNAKNPTHNYSTPGSYTVSLISAKCKLYDTISQTLTVLPSSISENVLSNINIYPNPSNNGVFMINSFGLLNEDGAVYSVQGKLVRNFEINSNRQSINLSSLPKGVYFIKFSSTNSSTFKKIIIN